MPSDNRPTPSLRLALFGAPHVRDHDEDRRIALTPRKALLLGVLSAAGSEGIRREKLGGLFWPGADHQTARNALKQLVFKTRRRIGRDEIIEAGEIVRLNDDILRADLHDVNEAMRRRDHDALLARLTAPFMDGVREWSSPVLDQWLDAQRARWMGVRHEAIEAKAESALRADQPAESVKWWRLLAAERPVDRWVHARLADALRMAGDVMGAAAVESEFRARQRQELEYDPVRGPLRGDAVPMQ